MEVNYSELQYLLKALNAFCISRPFPTVKLFFDTLHTTLSYGRLNFNDLNRFVCNINSKNIHV